MSLPAQAGVRAPYNQNKESGSIRLGLPMGLFEHFPPEVSWNGIKLLRKSEFHVTLLHVRSVPELTRVSNEELASFFASLVEKNPIQLLSFLNDFRYSEEDEKKTIVVRCVVSNLDELFVAFNAKFQVQLPRQPAHVTLYSLERAVGIHINSDEKMESLDKVDLPELKQAFSRTPSQT